MSRATESPEAVRRRLWPRCPDPFPKMHRRVVFLRIRRDPQGLRRGGDGRGFRCGLAQVSLGLTDPKNLARIEILEVYYVRGQARMRSDAGWRAHHLGDHLEQKLPNSRESHPVGYRSTTTCRPSRRPRSKTWVGQTPRNWRRRQRMNGGDLIVQPGCTRRSSRRITSVRVRVHGPAKTIADGFRYRNKMGPDLARETLRDGWR